MSFDAQNYLSALVERACRRLKGDEVLLASFSGEESDFVRLNNGAVRQAGSVSQLDASFDLVDGTRHAMGSIQLARNAETDDRRITELLIDLALPLQVEATKAMERRA